MIMRKLHKTDGSHAENISPAFYSCTYCAAIDFFELYKNQVN